MPKQPQSPDPGAAAFSISRQFTGPPFSHTLESVELRRKLMLDMARRAETKKPAAKPAKKRAK